MTYTGTDYDLDYLFVAELRNGQIIKQTPTDKSRISAWGSAFTDVVAENLDSIKRFSLLGKGHIYSVDLIDGHFEVDGHKLYPPQEVLPSTKLKLIYWRTVTRSLQAGEAGKNLLPKVKYILGWEYTFRGKNRKWEMGVE